MGSLYLFLCIYVYIRLLPYLVTLFVMLGLIFFFFTPGICYFPLNIACL